MERIQGQVPEHRKLATQVLSWISCARRRLKLAELQQALGIEENTPEFDEDAIPNLGLIVSTCTGLVVVDRESDVVRLVHHTTQEYFQRTWQIWFPNAQIEITKACATYLSFEAFKTGGTANQLEDRVPSRSFWAYAAVNWGHHAVHSLDGEILTLTLLEDTALVSACGKAICTVYSEHFSALHLAAYFGLSESASILLRKGADVDSLNFNRQTPLWFAAMHGHASVVKVLLENNADIERRDKNGTTPLYIASKEGHEAVVSMLLDNNAKFESSNRHRKTPLHIAAENGHEAVVRILLDNNANVKPSGRYRKPPHFRAATHQHKKVARMLLNVDGDIESTGGITMTPLHHAARNGHEAVVRLLLDNGANVESDRTGRTPLHYAASNGHEGVAGMLLNNDANVEASNPYGRTPLIHAVMRGDEGVVAQLLDNGANIESAGPGGQPAWQTALSLAIHRGNQKVINLLLKKKDLVSRV